MADRFEGSGRGVLVRYARMMSNALAGVAVFFPAMKRAVFFASALVSACASTTVPMPPDRPVVIVESIHCYVLNQVMFEKDAASVTPDAARIVGSLAATMISDPDNFVFVELAGHASADKRDAVELGARRASAVRDALIKLGVEASRMRAKGYGAYCSTRAKPDDEPDRDRRVETKVLRTKNGESGVELGCAAARAAAVVK